MSLNDSMAQVQEFHKHVGAPCATAPTLLACKPALAARFTDRITKLCRVAAEEGKRADDQLLLRVAMSLEETAEFLYAHVKGDLVAAADAWADRLYVLLGDAVAMGLPADELFAEIHASNMTKEPSRLSEPGKGVKGPGFQAPDIAKVLQQFQTKQPH